MSSPSPSPKTRIKLVGLVRVSSPGQKIKDTPETQQRELNLIARIHDAEMVEVVEVVGSVTNLTDSAKWKNRILPILHRPEVHLAVYHSDRLARPNSYNPKERAALWDIEKTQTRIYTTSGHREIWTTEGRQAMEMENMIAAGERDRIVARTTAGKIRCAAEGLCVQGAQSLPTGISFVKKPVAWGYTGDIWKVKTAFRFLVEEDLSYAEIARRVGMSTTPVRQWLQNDIYRGFYSSAWADEAQRVYGGNGQLEQAIPDEMWAAAQSIIEERADRNRKPKHMAEIHTLYSGILSSAYEPLGPRQPEGLIFGIGTLRSPRHVLYGHAVYGSRKLSAYACRCQHEGWEEKCGIPSWAPVERLHHAIDAYLTMATNGDWFVDHLASSLHRLDDSAAERPALEATLKTIDRKLRDAYRDKANGDLDIEHYRSFRAELKAEEETLKNRLDTIGKRPNVTPVDLRRMAQKMTWTSSWSVEEKRAWLAKYRVTITISKDAIEAINLRLPSCPRSDHTVEVTDDGLKSTPVTFDTPVWAVLGRISWTRLVGYDLSDFWSVLESEQGVVRSGRAAEILGISFEQLRGLVRSKKIPAPSRKHGRVWLWSQSDIKAAEGVLSAAAL